ncbi:hypothetical protein CFREI_12650 [Corynebacterium freiburgense]|nr:hypothetical protein CFREI_12650 [Corynebacterium freiburgense]
MAITLRQNRLNSARPSSSHLPKGFCTIGRALARKLSFDFYDWRGVTTWSYDFDFQPDCPSTIKTNLRECAFYTQPHPNAQM